MLGVDYKGVIWVVDCNDLSLQQCNSSELLIRKPCSTMYTVTVMNMIQSQALRWWLLHSVYHLMGIYSHDESWAAIKPRSSHAYLLLNLRSPRDCPSSGSSGRRSRLYVLDRKLLERLMSPSPKSQVMFASAFSWIGDFFEFLGFILFKLWRVRWI